ncbi:MAG: hypothetical protein ACKOZV_15615, partial [Bacteroidota bacterium]
MDTIQDTGRTGNAHLGIPLSGATDKTALAVGNIVLDNCTNAAAIECHWPAIYGSKFKHYWILPQSLAGA